MENIEISKINQTVMLSLYKTLLDCLYVLIIVPFFNWPLKISLLCICTGWLAILIVIPFVLKLYRQKQGSSLFMVLLNLMYFFPMATYYGYGGGSAVFFFYAVLYWAFLMFLQLKVPVIVAAGYVRKGGKWIFYGLFCLVALITVYMSWRYTGFRISLNISKVYNLRSEAAQYEVPTILSYAYAIVPNMISLLIVYLLHVKKYLFIPIMGVILLLVFSFGGHKTVLFLSIFTLIGFILYRNNRISWICPTAIAGGILCCIEYYVHHTAYGISYAFRRVMFVPVELSNQYYQFFNQNPTDIFRGSFLGKLGFTSVYQDTIPRMIGNNYYLQNVNSNNGLLGDVWSQLGFVGIFVMPIILIVLLRLFDFVTEGLDHRLIFGIVVGLATMATNASWSTMLLSHGFLLTCLLLFLIPRASNKVEQRGIYHEKN